MARIPRDLKIIPNRSVHKVWRGHNREPNLGSDFVKQKYLEFLNSDLESKRYQSGATLQALTLMTNHSHEVFFLTECDQFSNHMRRHHARYGQFFNRLKNRCGKVAQDRPHTTALGDSHHEMIAVFYIHANPVRAKMVGDARDYFWSTHNLYAFGKREGWMRNVKLPEWYMALGDNPELRQRKYRQLFSRYLAQFRSRPQTFLKKRFFGLSDWVTQRERQISEWRREHGPPPIGKSSSRE